MKKLLNILAGTLLLTSCHKPELKPTVAHPQVSAQTRIAIATAKANTISALQSAGIWSQLDMLQVRVDTSLSGAITQSDWIDTSRHPVSVGSITFTVNGGVAGNGTTGRVNTMFNPGNGGTYNFTLNSNCFGCYVGNRVVENKRDLSALTTGTTGNELQTFSTVPNIYAYNNEASQRTEGNDIGRGFYGVERTASNLWTIKVGGYIGTDFTDASTSIPNQPFWEYCRATNTTYNLYTTRTHYYDFAGAGTIDLFKLNSIMEQYYLIPLGLAPTKRITFLGNSFIAARLITQYAMAGINDYNHLDINVQGFNGYTTPQVLAKATTNVFPFQKSYLTNDVYFVDENTNDAVGNSATTCYNHMVTLCDSIRYYSPNAYIIVMTMPPRSGITMRQNDANLNDTLYLNGMYRVKMVRDGHCNYVSDIAADDSLGMNGQNLNNIYYKLTDHLHWTAWGTKRANDLYNQAAIQAGL